MSRVSVKLEFNNPGFVQVLTHPRMLDHLKGYAQKCADAAGEGFEVGSSTSGSRARASVYTATRAARRAEATDKTLTRSIRG